MPSFTDAPTSFLVVEHQRITRLDEPTKKWQMSINDSSTVWGKVLLALLTKGYL